MEEKDWLLLETLFNERNITRTAQLLYVSQPALTYRIHQIEREFGVDILIRRKKGVEFTEEGIRIREYSKRMLLELRKLKEQIANTGDTVKGTLRIGVSSTFAHYQLPELLKRFLDDYPEVEMNVKTGWSSEVLQTVQKEEVHIGIVRGDNLWQEQKCLLQTEPLYIVSRQDITLEQLPLVPKINYKTDFPLKIEIDNWWQQTYKTVPPLVTMEVDNIETCKELVKQGLGFAILPSVCLQDSDKLCAHPLISTEGEAVVRNTWLICRNELLELSVVRAFIEFATAYFL